VRPPYNVASPFVRMVMAVAIETGLEDEAPGCDPASFPFDRISRRDCTFSPKSSRYAGAASGTKAWHSISTLRRGSTSAEISTSVDAGRCSPK
jgi:hypothetical protein